LPHALFALKYLGKRHWLSEVVTIWDSIIFCTAYIYILYLHYKCMYNTGMAKPTIFTNNHDI
jgi:hypothetical protein